MRKKSLLLVLLTILLMVSCSVKEKDVNTYLDQYKENYQFKTNSYYEGKIEFKAIEDFNDDSLEYYENYYIKGLVTTQLELFELYSKYNNDLLFEEFEFKYDGLDKYNVSDNKIINEHIITNKDYSYLYKECIENNNKTIISNDYTYDSRYFVDCYFPSFLVDPKLNGWFVYYEDNPQYNTKYLKNDNKYSLKYNLDLTQFKGVDYKTLFPVLDFSLRPFYCVVSDNIKLNLVFDQEIVVEDGYIINLKTNIKLMEQASNKVIYKLDSSINKIDSYNKAVDLTNANYKLVMPYYRNAETLARNTDKVRALEN